MRTRAIATILAIVTGAAVLAGCGGDATGNEDAVKDDGSVDLSKVTLIVGDQKGTSAQALLKAAGLDDTPYKIQWQEFTSGPPMLEALNADSIHVGMVGNTPPIIAAAGRGEFKMVQAVTYTGEGDAIVVPKGSPIKSVADLKGKTVAVASGSSANYNLLAQLDHAGVKLSDVKLSDLQPPDALAAFDSGHIDAWAIWDPYTTQVIVDDGARVLADGSELMNGLNFQVASDAAIDDTATKAALSDYLGRITQAEVWAGENQDEWSKVWAEQTGLSQDVTLAASEERPVAVVPIDQSVIDSEQKIADAFNDNDLLPSPVTISDFFTDEFNDAVTAAAEKAGGKTASGVS
jgi:sulfonate transport system substrate-binding protein